MSDGEASRALGARDLGIEVLDRGHYMFDFSTATKLLEVSRALRHALRSVNAREGGSLRSGVRPNHAAGAPSR
jgi:hypothetical protein